jgi:hypothetical protein
MAEPSDDERYLVVDGRRWRRQDPHLPEDVAAVLKSELGQARSEIGRCRRSGEDPAAARVRVGLAKHGLGERGTPWWEQTPAERRERWEAAVRALTTDGP